MVSCSAEAADSHPDAALRATPHMVSRVESEASRGGPTLCGQQRSGLREGAEALRGALAHPSASPNANPASLGPLTGAEPTLADGFSSLALTHIANGETGSVY